MRNDVDFIFCMKCAFAMTQPFISNNSHSFEIGIIVYMPNQFPELT